MYYRGFGEFVHETFSCHTLLMSPRIIQIPLSGGDRKARAKAIRHAHGLHASYFDKSADIRSAAEEKLREADRLECEAWNAIMWAGGPAGRHPAMRTPSR
jgi:hypothetical protein